MDFLGKIFIDKIQQASFGRGYNGQCVDVMLEGLEKKNTQYCFFFAISQENI